MSGSSDSLSSDSSPSDEAASDPSDHEEPKSEPAAKAAAGLPVAKSEPRLKLKPRRPVEATAETKSSERSEEFRLSIETLQGRWRHSVAALGMLCVKGNMVSFSDGSRYVLQEISPGRIDMGGWQTIALKSSPEVIVWMLEGDPQTTCNWLLEEDNDQENALEGLDSRNIIQGKRKRQKVDYQAVEKEIDDEQKQYEDVFSDASSSSGKTRSKQISTEMTPKEWQEHHAKTTKKVASLFRRWMFSTCSQRHEELLKRKGKLQTRIPVVVMGPGRRMLEQELSPYGVQLRFHAQETLCVVDSDCRQRFQERHPAEWRAVLERRAASEAAEPEKAGQGMDEEAETPKKRRLRRVVTSDDEGEKEAPSSEPRVQKEVVQQASPMEVIQQAKKLLEANPLAEEVSKLLASLESHHVDTNLLVTTKIGVVVNGLRKTYAKHPEIVRRAAALVARWKELWMQERS